MKTPLVSVIVPLYNTEAYIRRCLESLREQTLQDMEIIVVNDASTDHSPELVSAMMKEDKRIRMVSHEENRGLYHARLTGVEQAKGQYIGFVDSDDYVSRDFFRELAENAQENGSDIVVGRLVHEDEKGYRYLHNTYDTYDFGTLEGQAPAEKYWEQEGRCFIWHTVWNKLYNRRLWEKALPVLRRQTCHLIMTEDFVFSSVLFFYAEKLTSVQYSRYYYFQHSGASTSLKGGAAKLEKNIRDLGLAFRFVHRFLKGDAGGKWEENFLRWRQLYAYFWEGNLRRAELPRTDRRWLEELLQSELEETAPQPRNPDWFYRVTTRFDDRYLRLVDTIASPGVQCVSFDIFDTAICRPFYTPTDLFRLMEGVFRRLAPDSPRDFYTLRTEAEKSLRREVIYCKPPRQEEVCLLEIYRRFQEETGLPDRAIRRLMEEEVSMELTFCRPRKSVQNLYEIARACGKKVYFTTDMYLDRATLLHLLEQNGYRDFDGLLISCETGKTKRTGTLFDLLLEETGLSPGQVLHIGDNWVSDVESPRRKKCNALFYPAPVECLQYNISDIPTTHSCCPYSEPSGSMVNWEKAREYLGTRTALAVAALKLYDMPFVSFNTWSEMNADPRFLGYYALGMHLLGVVRWIGRETAGGKYDTLAFIARDGYLPMRAWKFLEPWLTNPPKTAYLYTSRKAALAASVTRPEDLYALAGSINLEACTPNQLAEMMQPLLRGYDSENFRKEGIATDQPFENREAFEKFIRLLISRCYDNFAAKAYRQGVRAYFEESLGGNTVVYDIGYSGRTQAFLTRLLGKPVDGLYIHENDDACRRREQEYGFSVRSFYDYTPAITGVARELLFSQYAPSCTGYTLQGKKAVPQFEEPAWDYAESYLLSEIQESALDFVRDFCEFFGKDWEAMEMRNMDVSYPYEYFLHTLTETDAHLFDCCIFEDHLWAGQTFVLSRQWQEDIRYHRLLPFYRAADRDSLRPVEKVVYRDAPKSEEERRREEDLCHWFYMKIGLNRKSIISKGIFWLVVDPRAFWKRLKNWMRKGGKG